MHYFLRQVVSNNSSRPIEIHITEDEVHIGRKDLITLAKFPQISRHHAILYRSDNGSLFVKDLNSLNGIFVNDVKIGSSLKSLSVGDIIGFGVTCEQTEDGFVCVVCTDALSAVVKQEVIELSDGEEQVENVNSIRKSINSHIQQPTCSSRTQVLNGISSETNATNISVTAIDNIQTASSANSSTHASIVKSIALKTCVVKLVKCDSEQFKWPPDVKNPSIKKNNGLTYHEHDRKLGSNSSDDYGKRRIFPNSSSIISQNIPLHPIKKDVSECQIDCTTKKSKCQKKGIFTGSPVNLNQNTPEDFRNTDCQSSDNQFDSAANLCTGKKIRNDSVNSGETHSNTFASAENRKGNVVECSTSYEIIPSSSRQSDSAANQGTSKKIRNDSINSGETHNNTFASAENRKGNVVECSTSYKIIPSSSRSEKFQINDHVTDTLAIPAKIRGGNSRLHNSALSLNQKKSRNKGTLNSDNQRDDEQVRNRKRKCSVICSDDTVDVHSSFSSSNLKDKITGHVLQDNHEESYSQGEVIIISDDDCKSSPSSTPFKVEPEKVDDNEDIPMQITDNTAGQIRDQERENTLVPAKIRKRNDFSSRGAPKPLNINQDISLENKDHLNSYNQTHYIAENRKRKSSSVDSDDKISDNQFSDSYLNDETITSPEIQNNDDLNYSQHEEVIIISDDESYYDFKSSQTYAHIKTEPEEIDDNEDDICEQIFDIDQLSLPDGTRPGIFVQQAETDVRVESVESIQEFIISTESTSVKELESESNKKPVVPVNDFFPVLSQTSENDAVDNLDENSSCSDDLPISSGAAQYSYINLYNKEIQNDESNSVKNHRRAILIDAKPIARKQPRVGQKKRRSVGKHKKAYTSERENNLLPSIQSRNSKLNAYKIPRKSKVDTSINHSKMLDDAHISKPVSVLGKSGASIKKSPVKRRSDKFASRMGFLVNEVNINPNKVSKNHKRETGEQASNKKIASRNLGGKQDNVNNSSLPQNTPVPIVPSNKSVTQNMPVPIKPPNKPLPPNLAMPCNKSTFQNTSVSDVQSNMSVSNVPVSLPISNPVILPKVNNSGTLVFNPRDPRLNRTTSSLPRHESNELSTIAAPKQVKMNNIASNCNAAGRSVLFDRSNNLAAKGFNLIQSLLEFNVVWLQEQVLKKSPPPLVSNGVADLPLSFKSYDLYLSSFYPMLMLEMWEMMYTESKEIFGSNRNCRKFYFSVLSYTNKDDYVELKCESIVNENVCFAPRDGNLTILQLKESSKRLRSRFAYITNHKIEPLNLAYIKASHWKKLDNDWVTNARRWTFHALVKKSDVAFELNSIMKGNGLCYIKNKMRLVDALIYFKISPLLTDILQPRWNSFFVNYSASSATSHYSSCQMEVINGICDEINKPRREPKIILLQGPPGTGKTHTIVGLIEKLLHSHNYDSNFKILIAAPSNAAVDEIGCRLIELYEKSRRNVEFVRVGIEGQVNLKMKPYFIDRKAKKVFEREMHVSSRQYEKELSDLQVEIEKMEKEYLTPEKNEKLKYLRVTYELMRGKCCPVEFQEFGFKMKVLKQSHIILSTLSSCGLSVLLKTFKVNSSVQLSCCIIDESTQSTELDILQPLILGISKLVLVGDHEQLPATVLSKLACKHGFEKSMFERLHLYFTRYSKTTPMYTLSEQFRMHSAICEFPSKYFYNQKLITNPNTNLMYEDFPLHPYILLDILISQESSDLSSVVNCSEASVIVHICSYLQNLVPSASSIGIITPYQAQRSLYRTTLSSNPWYKDIEVNTVDGFQGREKDIIILSSVRANSQSGSIGFLASKQRLNVSITRARKCLIICAHTNSLMQNPHWRALVLDAKERNLCVGVTAPEDIPMIFKSHMKKQ